jgi:SAM-dependent methyltransferase
MFSLLKKKFYKFIPSAHASAYIRLLYLKLFLKKINFKNGLDAGCGPGLYTFFVAERFPEAHVTGYDISQTDIGICNQNKIRKKIDNVTFKSVDLRKLYETENYDFIFSVDVMEHIRGNLVVLRNIYNALEPGGIFYLAMPYEPGHRYLLPRKCFRNYLAWVKKEHVGEQYSLNAIADTLNRLGFSLIDAQYTFGFWGKLAWELDMATERHSTIQRTLKPLIFFCGYMDTLWRNGPGSHAIRVIAKK